MTTLSVIAGALMLGAACASAPAVELYPPPPQVGSENQRRTLAEQTREAVTESDPARRIQKFVELRAFANTIVREADNSEVAREAIAIFFARTAHVAIFNGDHSRGKGGVGSMPTEVTDMPDRIPEEMVALRMTQAQHWIQGLAAYMRSNNSLAGRMARSAGAFETSTGIYPRFPHVSQTLGIRQRNQIIATNHFDGLIEEMLREDCVAAASHLLRIERGLLQDQAEQINLLAVRHRMADVQQHYEDQALKRQYARSDAPLPYDAATAAMLQELAERPEWAVHLFVLSYMATGTDWYDQLAIDRIVAHQNPVSLRFLVARRMIDPALVPPPPTLGDLEPRARDIPASRPATQPAAVED